MALELFANQPSTTVASGGTDAPASGTQESWTVASSSEFPAASSGAAPATQFHIADVAASSELIAVTNVSGTTWTVIRGAESTTPVAHTAGFTIYQVASAGALTAMLTAQAASYQQLGGAHSSKLQGWFAALANRDYARANAVIIGTSITEGQGAASGADRYPAILVTQLRSRFPTAGLTGGGRGFLTPALTGTTSWSPTWVAVTGTLAQEGGYGPNNAGWDVVSGTTLVYSLTGDSADIMWLGYSGGGTFSYQVDSGSVTDVSTATSFSDGHITHVSLGSAGSHTLTITYVSGGTCVIDGVFEYDGDYSSGIQVHDGGHYGSFVSTWSGGTGTEFPSAIAAVPADLIVIELGVNDAGNAVTVPTFTTNMNTLIALLRGAFTTAPPILLLGVYFAAGEGESAAAWQAYITAMYAIAAGDPLIDVLDLTLRMPASNAANTWGLYAGDETHPSNNGHAMIADAICQFLSPA